jgi:hypothetical protein
MAFKGIGARKGMEHYVEVQDWDTKWPKWQSKVANARPGVDYFQAVSGWVRPGPVVPLSTDFDTLTDQQRKVLAQENKHYRDMELRMKGQTVVTIIAPGVYVREAEESQWQQYSGWGAG